MVGLSILRNLVLCAHMRRQFAELSLHVCSVTVKILSWWQLASGNIPKILFYLHNSVQHTLQSCMACRLTVALPLSTLHDISGL